MYKSRANYCALLLSLGVTGFAGLASAQEIVTLSTRAGVTQSYFLTSTPKNLQAVAVLFSGSGGLLQLRTEKGQPKFNQGNFRVRSRAEFVKRGVENASQDYRYIWWARAAEQFLRHRWAPGSVNGSRA